MHHLRFLRSVAVLLPFVALGCRLGAMEIEPIGPGSYPIACTNLEVTPRDGVPMFDFLNGKATAHQTIYLTDILTHPAAVPTLSIAVPATPSLFAAQAGTRIPVVLFVVYPTSKDNPRADYAFPYRDTGDKTLPHMQQPGDKPILPDAGKYPLIVNSGGYNTHPLWHLEHMKRLASHGYVVLDIVHGDGRGATFPGNEAIRPIELRAALDYLLRQSDFATVIDVDRIGAAGQSAGGHTILTAMGGIDPAGKMPAAYEPRIKAGFGLVPSMGGSFGMWPFKVDFLFFGAQREGLRQVRVPFFAVYGEKDTNVPPDGVEMGVRQMAGPATAVMLDGQTHAIAEAANSDVYTWEILFFNAWLRGDATARHLLETGTAVRGGVHDHKTIEHGAVGGK